MFSILKNLSTLIFLSSIFPSRGKVKMPMRVITPIEMKLMRFTKSFDSSEVLMVFAWIKVSWRRPKALSEAIPLS